MDGLGCMRECQHWKALRVAAGAAHCPPKDAPRGLKAMPGQVPRRRRPRTGAPIAVKGGLGRGHGGPGRPGGRHRVGRRWRAAIGSVCGAGGRRSFGWRCPSWPLIATVRAAPRRLRARAAGRSRPTPMAARYDLHRWVLATVQGEALQSSEGSGRLSPTALEPVRTQSSSCRWS